MTRIDDYLSGMAPTPITEAEAETLLGAKESPDPRLDELAAALHRIDLARLEIDLSDKAGRFSLRAAALARQSPKKRLASFWPRLSPRLAGAVAVTFALLTTTGLAAVADASAPGDWLYGLDRAVERVGLNDGGIQERLEEARVMTSDGRASEAVDHIADSLPEGTDTGAAADALHQAAERLQSRHNTEEVGEMLDWMASTEAEGREFGQGVAERAKELGNKSENPGADNRGPGNNSGNGPPGGTPPGQSGK